mmetsp:Transcript_15310/g.41414  ORF Transcript_15310/g.41414 Transcript_15310/m.41414 type:complete len:112 (-) Transcript_15310:266-601(-)
MHAAFPTSSPEVFHSQLVTRELVLTSMPQHTRRRVNDRPRQRTQGQQFPFAVARITENTAPPSQRAFTAPAYTAAGLPPPPDTQGTAAYICHGGIPYSPSWDPFSPALSST